MAAPRFPNDDEAAQYYLSALRDGTRAEKIDAREGLAEIFARRGLIEEAAELYELNVRAGVRTPELFERLSETYRQLGDQESAEAAFSEGQRLRAAVAPPVVPPPARPVPSTNGMDAEPFGPVEAGTAGSGSRVSVPSGSLDLAEDPAPAPLTGLADGRASDVTADLPPTDTSEPAPRDGRSIPRPLLVAGIVLFLIVLPVMLLAVLVVNPVALYLEGRAAGPTIDTHVLEPARLKVAAGASSAWYLQTGRSVSGLWATPGLELTLDQEIAGVGRAFAVTGTRPQSWGETITIVERPGQGRANQQTILPATFEAPASLPPAGTILAGHIAGQVTAPRLSESSQFNTATENVDLPVRLVVVSSPELWLDRFVNALHMFFDEDRWLLVTIGALLAWCILAGGAAILFRIGET